MSRTTTSATVRIADVVRETDDACSLVLDIPDAEKARFEYRPGQFVTVRIPSDRTGSVARCYSLASSPITDDVLKFTVKRTADGYASNWLCDNLNTGDDIELLPPSGAFTPKNLDDNFTLFAGGSGITPIISILKSVLSAGSGRIVLFYANRNAESVIFASELREIAAEHADRLVVIHWLESVQGLPTIQQISGLISAYSSHSAFMCGPKPFMDGVRGALSAIGTPRERVHAEVFTSLAGDPFGDASSEEPTGEVQIEVDDANPPASVSVSLDGDNHTLQWPRNQTLVDVMLTAGLDVPYSCRSGECGSCACTVTEGEVEMANTEILDPEDIADGYVLGCQAKPLTDRLTIEF